MVIGKAGKVQDHKITSCPDTENARSRDNKNMHIMFACEELCRKMCSPTIQAWRRLVRLGEYLISHPRIIWHCPWQEDQQTLVTFSYANWAGCHSTRKPAQLHRIRQRISAAQHHFNDAVIHDDANLRETCLDFDWSSSTGHSIDALISFVGKTNNEDMRMAEQVWAEHMVTDVARSSGEMTRARGGNDMHDH